MSRNQIACPQCGRINVDDLSKDAQPHCSSCQATLPWIVAAHDGNLAEILRRPILTLLKFTSASSEPCRKLDPILKEVAVSIDRKRPGATRIVYAELDDCPTAARAYQVMAVPTTFLVMGHEEVPTILGRFDGVLPPEQFQVRILETLTPNS